MPLLSEPQRVLVTTTGARSGRPRTVELLAQPHPEGLILIGSKAGAPTNPAWFHNLVANPEVTVRVGEQDHRMRARVTSGDERERLWAGTKQRFPGFADYERNTTRVIPVVVLREADGATS